MWEQWWQRWFEEDMWLLLRILIATILSMVIGFDREKGGRPAGLRTHMLVGLGASTFVVLGEMLVEHLDYRVDEAMQYDPIRILEAVVAGVAFLGAGTIFFSRADDVVKGLTTAASLWATAAVAMAAGMEHYVLAVGTTVLILVTLKLFHYFDK